MKFGQLASAIARKDAVCAAKCGEPIPKGTEYCGIYRINVKTASGTRSWVHRVHFACLKTWCDIQKANRDKARLAKYDDNAPRRGRPSLNLSPEEKRIRAKAQHSLWNAKERLLMAYVKDNDRINYSWVVLAEKLVDYANNGGKEFALSGTLAGLIIKRDRNFIEGIAVAKLVRQANGLNYRDPVKLAKYIQSYWNPDGSITARHHKYPEHRAAIEPEEELEDE